ncbi:hypothetical protein F5Y10DRAFT_250885 [Nemania abortiva]|nr:hypothetical protein F5Y10DRAFT_250885 [Nemania abortiva]
MALPFTVTTITVPLLLVDTAGISIRQPIRTGFGCASRISVSTTIWPSSAPYTDQKLSPWPVVFQIKELSVPFTLNGNFVFDATWRQPKSQFVVTGALGPVRIQSESFPVPADNDTTVTASGFTFYETDVPNAPFKCVGNWKWTITHIPPLARPAAVPVASKQLTCIEAYFFLGGIAPPFKTFHIAELLRLIVLDLIEVNAIVGDPVLGYASHIAWKMWWFGGIAYGGIQPLRYDCLTGNTWYTRWLDNTGNRLAFDLDLFLQRKQEWCNCHDLACIIQVCCAALGKNTTNHSFIETTRFFAQPFGYIPCGPLFGWRDYINVNNPFWMGTNGLQKDMEQMDPNRTWFDNHSWVQFGAERDQRILDITHGLMAGTAYTIFAGDETVAQYLNTSTEQGFSGRSHILGPHMGTRPGDLTLCF